MPKHEDLLNSVMTKARQIHNANAREFRKDNPEKVKRLVRASSLKGIYGITQGEYDSMFKAQNGLCKICQKPETAKDKNSLSVDHNHKTGKVGGLLCSRCNTGIGMLGDDFDNLIKAAKYIQDRDGTL